jgi:type I restriction enzyme, S subunit
MGQSPKGETCNILGAGLPLLNGPTEFGTRHPLPTQYTADPKRVARPRDLLFCVRGSTTGRMNWANQTYAIGRGIAAIRGKDGYPSSYVRATIEAHLPDLLVCATGSTFPNVSRDQLHSLRIPRITSEAAIAISSLLDPIDDRIALSEELNATVVGFGRAIFKSWFVDFDAARAKADGREPEGMDAATAALFPDSFEVSERGELPQGWRATKLGAEAERHGGRIQTGPFGSQLHASDYMVDGIPVVMPQDLSNRRVSTIRVARIKESDAVRLSRHRLEVGDIIYSRRGDVERHAQISTREAGWLCGTGCLLVRMGPRWPSPAFISLALDRPEAKAWISQHAIGATLPNLNTGILSDVPLIVPSEPLLQAFTKLVDPMEQLISENNARSQTLSMLRDTLLPRLISGKLRAPEAEKMVEAML